MAGRGHHRADRRPTKSMGPRSPIATPHNPRGGTDRQRGSDCMQSRHRAAIHHAACGLLPHMKTLGCCSGDQNPRSHRRHSLRSPLPRRRGCRRHRNSSHKRSCRAQRWCGRATKLPCDGRADFRTSFAQRYCLARPMKRVRHTPSAMCSRSPPRGPQTAICHSQMVQPPRQSSHGARKPGAVPSEKCQDWDRQNSGIASKSTTMPCSLRPAV